MLRADPSFHLPRRRFVKTFLLASASSSVAGFNWLGSFISEIRADDVAFPAGTFDLRLADFPALQLVNGSILLKLPDFPKIIITRLKANRFFAVSSVCTHQGCQVKKYNPTTKSLNCPCHHSAYKADGTVISGPAPKPLDRYPTHFNGVDMVTLDLVKFGYAITGTIVPAIQAGSSRMAITFQTETSHNYELLFRSSAEGPDWEPIPFSTTPDGPMTETGFIGTGEMVSLYVDRLGEVGFYRVNRWQLLGA